MYKNNILTYFARNERLSLVSPLSLASRSRSSFCIYIAVSGIGPPSGYLTMTLVVHMFVKGLSTLQDPEDEMLTAIGSAVLSNHIVMTSSRSEPSK